MTWAKDAAYNEIKFTNPVVIARSKWIKETDFPEMLAQLKHTNLHWACPQIFKIYADSTDGTTTVCLTQSYLCEELNCSQSVIYNALNELRQKKILVKEKKTPLGIHYYINKRENWDLGKKFKHRHQRRYEANKGKNFSFMADEQWTNDILELAKIKGVSINQLLKDIVYPHVKRELKKCRTQI